MLRCLMVFLMLAGASAWPLRDACADTVLLANGDRISGQVQGFDAGKLVIKTGYAGELRIDLRAVASWASEGEMTVVLDNDRRLYGRLEGDAAQVKVIASPGIEAEIPRSKVVSIQPGRLTADQWNLTGHLLLGASQTSGNTDVGQVNLDSELVARRGKDRYTTGLRANFAQSEGEQTANNWLLAFKYDRFQTPRWYWYGRTTFEHDPFADIHLRSTVGAGNGYQAIESARANFSVEGGLEYVLTDYINQPNDDFPAARLGIRFDVWLWQNVVQLYNTTSAYGNLQDFARSFARAETGLRFPLREGFLAQAALATQWQGNPPPGIKPVDQTLSLSIGYKW